MADDSTPVKQNLDFHSCNVPYGIPTFKLEDLSPEQQSHLNDIRIQKIRTNEIYLAAHPEVRAIIIIILKKLLISRPRRNIHGFISNVLRKNYHEISDEIEQYLYTRIDHKSERNSGVKIHRDEIYHDEESTTSTNIEEETTSLQYIQGIIEDITDVAIKTSPGPVPKEVKLIMSEILDEVIVQVDYNERRSDTESPAVSFKSLDKRPLGSELKTKGKFKIQGQSLEFMEQLSLQPSMLSELTGISIQELGGMGTSQFAALLAHQQQQDDEDTVQESSTASETECDKFDDQHVGEEEYGYDDYKRVYEDIYKDLDRNLFMNLSQVHSRSSLDGGSESRGDVPEDEEMRPQSTISSNTDQEEYK